MMGSRRKPAKSGGEDPLDAWGSDDERSVISSSFGGDADLYREFLQACQAQFPRDVDIGDRACAVGDADTLRHLTHSLKSVLRSLGRVALGDQMGEAELLAAQGDLEAAARVWGRLRAALLRLTSLSLPD